MWKPQLFEVKTNNIRDIWNIGFFSLPLPKNDKIEISESEKYGKCRQWILQTLMG